MIIKEKVPINAGLLMFGDEVIAVCEDGVMEQEYFVPDRFMYEFIHTFPVKEAEE